jgi:hypothetical protein
LRSQVSVHGKRPTVSRRALFVVLGFASCWAAFVVYVPSLCWFIALLLDWSADGFEAEVLLLTARSTGLSTMRPPAGVSTLPTRTSK